MRCGNGPRRRRMIRGTIARTGELAMRYGHVSQLATLDCTSSRRSTVMCALPQATVVTTVYQSDSSSNRRVGVPQARRAYAAKPLLGDNAPSIMRKHRGLTGGHSISARTRQMIEGGHGDELPITIQAVASAPTAIAR